MIVWCAGRYSMSWKPSSATQDQSTVGLPVVEASITQWKTHIWFSIYVFLTFKYPKLKFSVVLKNKIPHDQNSILLSQKGLAHTI